MIEKEYEFYMNCPFSVDICLNRMNLTSTDSRYVVVRVHIEEVLGSILGPLSHLAVFVLSLSPFWKFRESNATPISFYILNTSSFSQKDKNTFGKFLFFQLEGRA
jgi:hypothetical protein